jgi:hypothetical protein
VLKTQKLGLGLTPDGINKSMDRVVSMFKTSDSNEKMKNDAVQMANVKGSRAERKAIEAELGWQGRVYVKKESKKRKGSGQKKKRKRKRVGDSNSYDLTATELTPPTDDDLIDVWQAEEIKGERWLRKGKPQRQYLVSWCLSWHSAECLSGIPKKTIESVIHTHKDTGLKLVAWVDSWEVADANEQNFSDVVATWVVNCEREGRVTPLPSREKSIDESN